MRTSHVAIAGALLLASACAREGARSDSGQTRGGGEVIATYAGKEFRAEDFRREVERLPPRSRMQVTTPERRRQFVDNYVMNQLLADEGRAKGYDEDPEVVRQVDELRQRLIVQRMMKDFQEAPELTDQDVRAHYDQNQRLFSGAQIRASHILVKDEALAKSLREQLRADPTRFEELARTSSTDAATAARGGDLGFFGQGRMVADFERAAFALESPGDLSEVVKTPFGYHIIKLTERKEGTSKPFDEVKDRIRVALLNERRQQQVSARFEELKARAKVSVNEDALARVEVPGTVLPTSSPAAPAPAPTPPPPSGPPA